MPFHYYTSYHQLVTDPFTGLGRISFNKGVGDTAHLNYCNGCLSIGRSRDHASVFILLHGI